MKNRKALWLTIVLASMAAALLSLTTFKLFAPITLFANTPPPVVPVLREWHGSTGAFVLSSHAKIVLDPTYASMLQETALLFQQDLAEEAGPSLAITTSNNPGTGNFYLTLKTRDGSIGDEGYLFNVSDTVTIDARTTSGVFYGTRTVLQILRAATDHVSIPKGYARDYPAYKVRGFMLDVGRKFVPLNILEDYVRLMSWYKFNDFQLHFNDNALNAGNQTDWKHQYAAFRLNSPAFPGLAAADGSYTEQQIQELERVAAAHSVTITPEIDTPAHALALTQYRPLLASPTYSKEFLDLNNSATYSFVDSLWNTFLPWFTTNQINIGADEYDQKASDKYREYINHYDDFFHQRGKAVRMWGSLSQMKSNVKVHSDIVIEDWNNTWANPVDMENQGFQLINVNDALLYIVPHTTYYHDFLDTQVLYQSWEPNIFSLQNPALNLKAGDPHLLGAMFAVWNDKLGTLISDADITARIKPAMPVLGEKMWSGPTPGTDYVEFEQVVQLVGLAPGTHLS